jgi:glucose/arabinose dehydrogenase
MEEFMEPLFRVAPRRALALILMYVLGASSAFALDTELIQSGFNNPVFLTAPAGDSRLFVVERTGKIQVRSGNTWSTFLDITGQVDSSGERGLLGLAFDPNYATNRTFYVDYIDNTTKSTQIARFTATTANPNVADSTGAPILSIAQPPNLSNHKAGWIGFRPGESNNLYIATGDGGGGNDLRLLPNGAPDPNWDNNAQNTNRMLGKVLRIDVHPANPNVPYSIPATNPFANGGGAPEVWDYGLRNPFRDSFDRTKGNLIIGDVGQGAREEVDFEPASSPGGNNYGWRLREGRIETPTVGVGGPLVPGMVDPVYDYEHGGGTFHGSTVIGGYVYRGSLLKNAEGQYFFGDFGNGQIWSMDTDPVTGELLVGTLRDRTAELHRLNSFSQIVSFGEDGFGNLYVVDLSGRVFEIVPEPRTYAILSAALALLVWRMGRRGQPSPIG